MAPCNKHTILFQLLCFACAALVCPSSSRLLAALTQGESRWHSFREASLSPESTRWIGEWDQLCTLHEPPLWFSGQLQSVEATMGNSVEDIWINAVECVG